MQCILFTCSFASNRQSKYNHLKLSTPSMAAMLVAADSNQVRGLAGTLRSAVQNSCAAHQEACASPAHAVARALVTGGTLHSNMRSCSLQSVY